jgi:hypothetical protein
MIVRERLPNRRRCETVDLDHAGHRFTLTTGYYRDGRIAEIFISSSKPGSPIEAIARDAAVTVSIALQFGADLATKRYGLQAGWPDLILVSPCGQMHCLELKRIGKTLSDDQEDFRDWCIRHGVPHVVAFTIDEVLTAFDQWGCLRIKIGGRGEGTSSRSIL